MGTSSVTTNVGDNQGDLVVDRLQRYEERSSTPLLMLAIGFITVYAIPIIDTGLPHGPGGRQSRPGGVIWMGLRHAEGGRMTVRT